MAIENPDFISIAKGWPYAALAAVGGFLGYTLRSIDRREGIRWGRAVIETLAAGFVGLLVLLLCQANGLTGPLTGFIAGVLGWAGAPASMLLLERVVFKKLGINEPGAFGVESDDEPCNSN